MTVPPLGPKMWSLYRPMATTLVHIPPYSKTSCPQMVSMTGRSTSRLLRLKESTALTSEWPSATMFVLVTRSGATSWSKSPLKLRQSRSSKSRSQLYVMQNPYSMTMTIFMRSCQTRSATFQILRRQKKHPTS